MWYFFLHVHTYIYILTLRDGSQFADSLHPVHIVTLGSLLGFRILVAKRGAMNTFDLEGRIVCSLLLVVVMDWEYCEMKNSRLRRFKFTRALKIKAEILAASNKTMP